MSQDYLGEFEQMVLLSIIRLEHDAYGLAMLNTAHQAPGTDVGGSCDGVRKRFSQVFDDLKQGKVE